MATSIATAETVQTVEERRIWLTADGATYCEAHVGSNLGRLAAQSPRAFVIYDDFGENLRLLPEHKDYLLGQGVALCETCKH